jgi:hypothetical protein
MQSMKVGRLLAPLFVALIGCTSPSALPSADPGGAASPDSSAGPSKPAAAFRVEQAGLRLTATFDRLEVEPGGNVGVQLTLQNDRSAGARFEEPCDTGAMTVEVPVPSEPIGRRWAGIAAAFKTYALEQSTGSPIESSVRTPMKTLARALPCHAAVDEQDPLIPMATYETIPAGATYETVLTWTAELVRDLPAGPGDVPFSVQVQYDQEAAGRLVKAETIEVTGTITIAPGGDAPAVTAGKAIDAVLDDTAFSAWLAKQPRKAWVNANLFLQPGAVGVAVLPEVPYWDVELFREPRNWAILYVDARSGAILSSLYCNIPCDR